jgi:hypothetical protein
MALKPARQRAGAHHNEVCVDIGFKFGFLKSSAPSANIRAAHV